jgi:hypothetical protein
VLRERLISEVLAISLADNRKARFLQSDGSYRRAAPVPGGTSCRSQFQFLALAATEEDGPRKPLDGKTRYPQVRLVPSPFVFPKGKK